MLKNRGQEFNCTLNMKPLLIHYTKPDLLKFLLLGLLHMRVHTPVVTLRSVTYESI